MMGLWIALSESEKCQKQLTSISVSKSIGERGRREGMNVCQRRRTESLTPMPAGHNL